MHDAGMRRRWRRSAAKEGVPGLARRLGVHRLVAELMLTRGLSEPDHCQRFLHPKLTHLHDPADLPGVTDAARRIERAVRDGQPIVIYGDYDVDGITAAAILWHVLTLAGARASTYVPHRLDEGYGLNTEAIRALASDPTGNPPAEPGAEGRMEQQAPLIISVDCGITAIEPARVAKDLGVDLIITDHHQFDPEHLPEAHTLVHPGLPVERRAWSVERDAEHAPHSTPHTPRPTPYPFGELCGAGVAFKLAWQFAKTHCGSDQVSESFRELLLDLLSMAALGTVADVVPLVEENRVLTVFGLGRIKQTRFVGLNALIDAAGLRDEKIDAYHVGFVLGPRLNACGRMGHAKQAVHLLTEATEDEAAELAGQLARENDRRRATERAIFHDARQMVEQEGYDARGSRAIVLGKEGWHPGVVGIVASRLVDRYARPVVLLNYDNGMAQGSARSVDGVSIHAALDACREHLDRFGGHAMAAGLTLQTERVQIFREALVAFVNRRLPPDELVRTVDIDAEIAPDDCTLNLFDQIESLAPFGRGNEQPKLLLRDVTLDRPAQRIGGEGRHLSLLLRSGRDVMRAVGFGLGDLAERLPAGAAVDVVFKPKVSTWQGRRRPDFHVEDVKLR